MNPADREQLDAVVAVIREAFGAGILGIYQYGSAISGELRPLSDLDVLQQGGDPPQLLERSLPKFAIAP